MQMEHALIAVKMVSVAWFTSNSFRKQVLAFPVVGQQHGGGFCVHQLWNMGLSEGFVFLRRKGGKERNAYSCEEGKIISGSLF